MSEAIQPLPLEALDFIKEGTPKPQVAPVLVDPTKMSANALPIKAQEIHTATKPKPEKEREVTTDTLVSTTFRLPSSLLTVLLKASSERKIKKLSPHSQQDIMAVALRQWIEKNGYSV